MKKMLVLMLVSLKLGAKGQAVFTADYASQADVNVFVVDYESQADLKVFKVAYASQAKGNEGKCEKSEFHGTKIRQRPVVRV